MEVRISGSWKLSDEHAASSYGQPVLVDPQGQVYGPGDIVQIFPSWSYEPARAQVKRLVSISRGPLSHKERLLVDRFLKEPYQKEQL